MLVADPFCDELSSEPPDTGHSVDIGNVWIFPPSGGAFGLVERGRVNGRLTTSGFGVSISGGLDRDGDGLDDVIVGAPRLKLFHEGESSPECEGGGAYVFYSDTISTLRVDILPDPATISGDAHYGHDVLMVPSLDGDPFADMIIGAPFADDAQSGLDSGKVEIYTSLLVRKVLVSGAPESGSLFGWALALIGDLDGDGTLEFAVSAPLADGGIGRVFIFSGADPHPILFTLLGSTYGFDSGDQFGFDIDGTADLTGASGDVSGDGFPDIVVGVPFATPPGPPGSSHANAGSALVINPITGVLIARVDGINVDDHVGWSVSGVADVDGLGVATPEVLIGVPDWDVVDPVTMQIFVNAGEAVLLRFPGGVPITIPNPAPESGSRFQTS